MAADNAVEAKDLHHGQCPRDMNSSENCFSIPLYEPSGPHASYREGIDFELWVRVRSAIEATFQRSIRAMLKVTSAVAVRHRTQHNRRQNELYGREAPRTSRRAALCRWLLNVDMEPAMSRQKGTNGAASASVEANYLSHDKLDQCHQCNQNEVQQEN